MEKPNLLELELIKAKFLKETNRNGNFIYKFSAEECPALMQEVGRLREISFRYVGGGTNNDVDIDEYDTYFDQLIVWNPKEKKIIGGYRIQKMGLIKLEWSPLHYFFSLSESFIAEYAPHAVELGRSFIIPEYQDSKKGPFALDNLFDAIGAWISRDPSIKYLVGKITLYPKNIHGNQKDLSMVYEAIEKYFSSQEKLIKPRTQFMIDRSISIPSSLLCGELKKDINLLMRKYNAPQLLSVYSGLSPSMKTFGTILHKKFGNAEETAMMITIPDIYPNIKERYNL